MKTFNSGTSHHISPYQDNFATLSAIAPQTLHAANKGIFTTIGIGELVTDIPNGVDVSQLQLTEVLYSPEVGYTLIPIGWLDKRGFSGKAYITLNMKLIPQM